MLHLFSLTGEPSDNHFLLMNGDLVDRGSWSIEVILVAFAYKCECSMRNKLYRLLIQLIRAISEAILYKSRKS